jgi:hypothetical protein
MTREKRAIKTVLAARQFLLRVAQRQDVKIKQAESRRQIVAVKRPYHAAART